jgi:NADH-quinone oxidoreductase subunit F
MSDTTAVVEGILERYPRDESSLIMVLQDVQEALNYLPEEAVAAVADGLSLPRSRVYSVASFYRSFSLEPRGKHQVNVCVGTACHVRGAGRLVNQLSEELDVPVGGTTADGEFTLETVRCVGACALGPVVLVDGEVHGDMTPRRLTRLIEKCRAEGAGAKVAEASRGACRSEVGATEEVRAVGKLSSLGALADWRERLRAIRAGKTAAISVCAGSGCRALGSLKLIEAFAAELRNKGLTETVRLQANGCHGACEGGILVVLRPQGILYQKVKLADVSEIIEKTVTRGEIIERLLFESPTTAGRIPLEKDIPFYARQTRLLMSQNALIDPRSIEDYVTAGGYASLAKVLTELKPEAVIEEMKRAGLRGRGGAGFLTARKWASCRRNEADSKYILCNADEGDPGAFMDGSLLEGNPHSVIEGMIIGAYAIAGPGGENSPRAHGYVYVRHEYPMAVANLVVALEQARSAGLLGENILGSGFSYDIRVSRGGGAFVCGESTALMASIEGKIGEPRAKYVHTAKSGLYGKPTVLNNVETWANVPLIIRDGAARYSEIGTAKNTGTKIFSLVGDVNNTGLVEVPMGITLREIIFDIGGGIRKGRRFKAVQTGGPSGGCLPESLLDTPVDFDALTSVGSMMGSGGMIVMDENTCMVDVARYFVDFLNEESCGKCVACRLGLANTKEILDRICRGEGVPEDLSRLERLFSILDEGSLCGLGKSAANPVRSTLRYFREEYEAHIEEKRCPAGVCRALITYFIDETCTGCGACIKVCPREAISGEKKQLHMIDPQKCDRCGLCVATCAFDSIRAR